jgi:hypothetical protein
MLFIIQYPITDVRKFINTDAYYLSVPSWPLPRINREFIRNFGITENRKKGGINDWPSEGSYCTANNLIIIPHLEKQYIFTEGDFKKAAECVFRRFYSDGNSVCRIEIGFKFDMYSINIDSDKFFSIIENLLKIDVIVKTSSEKLISCKLIDAYKYINKAYLYSSTSDLPNKSDFLMDWWVISSNPFIFIEYEEKEEKIFNIDNLMHLNNLGSFLEYEIRLSHFWYNNLNNIPLRIWISRYHKSGMSYNRSNSPEDFARKVRLSILRLNAEQESIKNVLRLISQKKIVITPDNESCEKLQQYLNRSTKKFLNKSSFGLPQHELLDELLKFEDIVNESERVLLLEETKKIRKQIKKKLDEFSNSYKKIPQTVITVQNINNRTEITNIEEVIVGDKFSDISNSTIYNKSTFDNSFNKVKSEHGEDVASLLNETADKINKSKNKEAAEIFDSFNEELQKEQPKKTTLKSFWDSIVRLVPEVSTIVGLAEKIIKIF